MARGRKRNSGPQVPTLPKPDASGANEGTEQNEDETAEIAKDFGEVANGPPAAVQQADVTEPNAAETEFVERQLTLLLHRNEPISGPTISLVQTRLTPRRRRALRLLRESLYSQHAEVDTKHVDSHSDVVRWLLDRVADAAGLPDTAARIDNR